MYLVVGLGNPTDKYKGTRHNVGFEAIDALAEKYNIEVRRDEHRGLTGKGLINGNKVMLVKPLTFMNLSGECVGELCNYYDVDPSTNLIVLSDDVYLDCGMVRIRTKGSHGGHNGLKNIISHVGGDYFTRVRIGVGKMPKEWDLADFVLAKYSNEDRAAVDEGIKKAVGAVELLVAGDEAGAMNNFNGKA